MVTLWFFQVWLLSVTQWLWSPRELKTQKTHRLRLVSSPIHKELRWWKVGKTHSTHPLWV